MKKTLKRLVNNSGSSDYKQASDIMKRVLVNVVNYDQKHKLSQIYVPTLLVWGSDDNATPISDAHQMEKLIADSGLVVFESCGHFSYLEQPKKFLIVLSYFLDN